MARKFKRNKDIIKASEVSAQGFGQGNSQKPVTITVKLNFQQYAKFLYACSHNLHEAAGAHCIKYVKQVAGVYSWT